MNSSSRLFAAAAAGVALAATLGLAACSGQNAAQDNSEAGASQAATEGSAESSTVAEYNLTSVWVGMNDDSMVYYFEGADQTTGAVLVYHTADNAYERWAGAMEQGADAQKTITDGATGEEITFTVSAEDADGIVEFASTNGIAASMSAMEISEVSDVLDTIGTYATKVGEQHQTAGAADLGGEFVVRVNTEGIGQVSCTQDGESLDWGDSVFAHADAGDVLILSAQPREDGWTFVKWTRDGEDISTDPEVKVTIDGDVEYIAVFE